MTTDDLCIGRRVFWRGLPAIVIDIHWFQTPLIRIKVFSYEHWTTADQLEVRP
jgi:hypothetical protein